MECRFRPDVFAWRLGQWLAKLHASSSRKASALRVGCALLLTLALGAASMFCSSSDGATMLIEVRTDSNIQGGEQFSDQVKTVVQAALDRFGDRIRRIDVHLSDSVGDKAGHDDKCCKIEARRDGREPIVVMQHEPTMNQAIRAAVHSLKKSMVSAFGKESTLDQLRDRQ